jgi:GPH family glycoside/pentoside/hexuronide:cation symporter
MPGQTDRVSTSETIVYSLPGLVLAAVGVPLYVYIPKFYTDVVGVSATAMGGLILAARLADAASDPIVGVASDRTRSRFGRRRPYIALGSLALSALLAALYVPPAWEQQTVTLWFAASILLLSLAWTLVDVPWESLGPEITFGYDERTALFSFREGMTIAGTLLAAAAPWLIERGLLLSESDADQRTKFAVFAAIFIPLTLICCWTCAARIREKSAPSQVVALQGRKPFGASWREAFSNRPFLVLLAAYAVASVGSNLPATLIVYYVEYVLGSRQTEIFILLYVSSGIAFLPLWLWISRRRDKKRAWIAALSINAGAFFGVFFLGRGDLFLYGVLTLISGTGFGASLALPAAMQADVIDYDELLHGERREGRFIGVWSVVKKGSSAVGLGLALPLLDAFGYQPGKEQTHEVKLALRVLYCLIPCVCLFGAILISLAYPLSRARHQAVLEGIERRRRGQRASDPLQPSITLHPPGDRVP